MFGKNSYFVRYFGEGSFLTNLVRQCSFRYLKLKSCGFMVLETGVGRLPSFFGLTVGNLTKIFQKSQMSRGLPGGMGTAGID